MPDSFTQTINNNTIQYKAPILFHSQTSESTSNVTYNNLKDVVSIDHSNAIVTDATHTNLCAYNDIVVKGNIFVGDVLLTPKTIKVNVELINDITIPLNLDGNHGNILFDIINTSNTEYTITLELQEKYNRQHGFLIFNNLSNTQIKVQLNSTNVIIGFTIIILKPKSTQYITYYILEDNIFLRESQNYETADTITENDIDRNDMKNVLLNNINQIKLENPLPNQYLVATSTGAQWIDNVPHEIESCNTHVINNGVLSLCDLHANTITINLQYITDKQMRIEHFDNSKKVGEGQIIIKSHLDYDIDIIFLEGFVISNTKEKFVLNKMTTQNNPSVMYFWYNYIGSGFTILKKTM